MSGVPDSRWDNDELQTLGRITGSDFEAVDTSSLQVSANSGQAAAHWHRPSSRLPTRRRWACEHHGLRWRSGGHRWPRVPGTRWR